MKKFKFDEDMLPKNLLQYSSFMILDRTYPFVNVNYYTSDIFQSFYFELHHYFCSLLGILLGISWMQRFHLELFWFYLWKIIWQELWELLSNFLKRSSVNSFGVFFISFIRNSFGNLFQESSDNSSENSTINCFVNLFIISYEDNIDNLFVRCIPGCFCDSFLKMF